MIEAFRGCTMCGFTTECRRFNRGSGNAVNHGNDFGHAHAACFSPASGLRAWGKQRGEEKALSPSFTKRPSPTCSATLNTLSDSGPHAKPVCYGELTTLATRQTPSNRLIIFCIRWRRLEWPVPKNHARVCCSFWISKETVIIPGVQ
jgi:hypothetical protein